MNPLPDLASGTSLTFEEAHDFAMALFSGQVPEGLIGGTLTALAIKGETPEEVAGFATSMRAHVRDFGFKAPEAVDTCGTGGSGLGAFNTGTLSALIVAAAGGKAAKHGNRAITGKCGSADILEALGLPLELEPEAMQRQYKEHGFVFLFAPACHPAMKYAGPVRKALGIPTVFNLLGPLTNPLGVRRQMLGVGKAQRFELMAQVLADLGVDRAVVLHADSGLDEVDVSGPTKCALIEGTSRKDFVLTPEELLVATHPLKSLLVQSVDQSLALVRDVLSATPGPALDFTLANTGVALFVAGLAADPADGVVKAKEVIESGKLASLIEALKAA